MIIHGKAHTVLIASHGYSDHDNWGDQPYGFRWSKSSVTSVCNRHVPGLSMSPLALLSPVFEASSCLFQGPWLILTEMLQAQGSDQ